MTMARRAIPTTTATIITSMGILDYDFMLRAFAASGIVALVAGIVGVFLVLRGQTFAGHALSHVGFAGATAAGLIGLSPLAGMIVFTVAAGVGMGALGEKLSGRDVAVGIVLALSLGFGLLFLHFYTSFATQATALLFGNVLAVSTGTLVTLVVLGIVALAALAFISRPLLFATLQPELAEAKGVSQRLTGILFMAIVALTVSASVQIVGVLLVFTLMVGPAATAERLTRRLGLGVLVAAVIALVEAWAGIAIAFYTDWPVSFCITALSALAYFAAVVVTRDR
jgi:zinc/manganese transport system permease protein